MCTVNIFGNFADVEGYFMISFGNFLVKLYVALDLFG